jgi:deoxyribonucleoside regulator
MERDKLHKIVEAARLYYQLDYSQQEIAKRLGVSRPTVSRLLQQAKADGIVQITIMDPAEDNEVLALELARMYGLKKVLVVSIPEFDDQVVKEHLGKAAAQYLNEIVKDNDTIGMTWGTTLHHVAMELKPKQVKDVRVVQLKGGVSLSETNTYASEILHLFGKAYDTLPHHLPIPAIVDHPAVKQAIEADRHIRRVLDLGKQANIALFTVGSLVSESLLFRLGYFSEEERQAIHAHAVGDISSRFFDKDGNICIDSVNERTIGIELNDLKRKEYSILIAGGPKKVAPIHAALTARYANVFITDQFTAKELLNKEDV